MIMVGKKLMVGKQQMHIWMQSRPWLRGVQHKRVASSKVIETERERCASLQIVPLQYITHVGVRVYATGIPTGKRSSAANVRKEQHQGGTACAGVVSKHGKLTRNIQVYAQSARSVKLPASKGDANTALKIGGAIE